MEGTPVVEKCPNCGAPLELENGKCRWCQAAVHVEAPESAMPAAFAPLDERSLVPDSVDDESVASFIYLIVQTLKWDLGGEQVVLDYVDGNTGMREEIRALSVAVGTAAVRVRDDGSMKDEYMLDLSIYTPDEIWTFDLAIDLIVMAGALPGLPAARKASIAEAVRLLEDERHSHTWKHDMKKAGDGPEALRDLRGRVPRS